MKNAYALVLSMFFLVMVHPVAAENLPLFARYPNLDRSLWQPSHGWSNGPHQSCEWRADAISGNNNNMQMRLSNRGGRQRPIGCGEIQSKRLFSYGRFEARMRSAAGSGLNTAFFTYIGPPLGVKEHDEIDFEFLGKDPRTVELAYWANGRKLHRHVYQLGYDASLEFHDYAFEWSRDSIKWFIDGQLIHTTATGAQMPRNPAKLMFSLWSGSKIEDAWMGSFRYNNPVTAEVAWVKFTPLP